MNDLINNEVISISKIELWLLKYEKQYKISKRQHNSKFQYEIEGEIVRLPDDIANPSPEEQFISIYDTLDELSMLHRNENYFKHEMAIYKRIKDEPLKVNQWIKKNAKLGGNDYVCFMIDYLDYDKDNNEFHLKVSFPGIKDLNIFIDREDFTHTILFLKVFDENYWSNTNSIF